MINWPKTNELGIFNLDKCKLRSKIYVFCDGCSCERLITIRDKSRISNNNFEWYCPQCVSKRKEIRHKLSQSTKRLWDDENYRKTIIESSNNQNATTKSKLSESTKNNWKLGKYSGTIKSIKHRWQNDEYKEMLNSHLESIRNGENHKKAVGDPKYRATISEKSREKWLDPQYRSRMMEIRANQPRVSNIQHVLYSILEDLNIKHYKEYNDKPNDSETIVGPYEFDCVIPLRNKKLLIECQGDYWHSLSKSISRDKSKATYIEKYHPDYEIKYLWEHEFKCKDKIVELIKYWTGKTEFELIDFSFNDVEIKKCESKDYKLLLSKYHYLPNAGRGGVSFGAYLDNELMAVCVFSPLIRQNLPYDPQTTRELSRLCIHPRYQKKNFASWFVSKCIKLLNPKHETIVSYCDTTFNHDGAVYRACNFELDGKVKPDYWYVDEDGWVMHKKTLYNHAVKMKTNEDGYAQLNGYKKIYGKEKLRFIYHREKTKS